MDGWTDGRMNGVLDLEWLLLSGLGWPGQVQSPQGGETYQLPQSPMWPRTGQNLAAALVFANSTRGRDLSPFCVVEPAAWRALVVGLGPPG